MIEHLNAKPKYWPVELKHPVPALTKAKNVDNIVPSTEATISLENEEQIKTDSLAVTESAENEHITIPVTSTDEVVLDIPDDNQTTATISTEDSSLNKSEQQVVSNELDLITTVAETDANHSSRRTKSFIGCAPEPNNTLVESITRKHASSILDCIISYLNLARIHVEIPNQLCLQSYIV